MIAHYLSEQKADRCQTKQSLQSEVIVIEYVTTVAAHSGEVRNGVDQHLS